MIFIHSFTKCFLPCVRHHVRLTIMMTARVVGDFTTLQVLPAKFWMCLHFSVQQALCCGHDCHPRYRGGTRDSRRGSSPPGVLSSHAGPVLRLIECLGAVCPCGALTPVGKHEVQALPLRLSRLFLPMSSTPNREKGDQRPWGNLLWHVHITFSRPPGEVAAVGPGRSRGSLG